MMDRFNRGVNLGGWLSQYPSYDHGHFQSFIGRRDLEQIAAWGFDHVRLPVDYPVIEADEAPGVPIEQGYGYIDDCLEWCEAVGLAVVLDIHEAPGFTFINELEEETRGVNRLFEEASLQDRFVALWEAIVARYAHTSPVPVVFELLNEVSIPDSGPWNDLYPRAVRAMRAIAPEATILVGGNHNNSVGALKDLAVVDDPGVEYTFHFYEPLLFTHQNAWWSPPPREWGESPDYPGGFPGLGEFLEAAPQHRAEFGHLVGRALDRDLLAEYLQPAFEFTARAGRGLYCGEFGVAEWIPAPSRRRWMADFVGLLRDAGFGYAVWSYKQMDFGLVGADGALVDPEILRILTGHRA